MSFSDDVKLFFPSCDLANGAFGLLGIPPLPTDRSDVYIALRARIQHLDSGPYATHPSASMVREALHVAAAQLADRKLQDGILAQLRAARLVADQPVGVRPTDPHAQGEQAVSADVLAMLRHVLASSGGWNRAASKRLARFGGTYGLTPGQLRAALISAARSEHGVKQRIFGIESLSEGANTLYDSTAEAQRAELFAPPRDPRIKHVLTASTILLTLSAVGLGVLSLQQVLDRRAQIAAAQRAVDASLAALSSTEIESEQRLNPDEERQPIPAFEAYQALAALDTAAFSMKQAESIDRFTHAMESLAVAWERLPPELARNIPTSVRDVLYAAAEETPQAIPALLSYFSDARRLPEADVSESILAQDVFAVCVLNQLSSGELPSAAAVQVRKLVDTSLPPAPRSSDSFSDAIDDQLFAIGISELRRGVVNSVQGAQGAEKFWTSWMAIASRSDRVLPLDQPRGVRLLIGIMAGSPPDADPAQAEAATVALLRSDIDQQRTALLGDLLGAIESNTLEPSGIGVLIGVQSSGYWPTIAGVQLQPPFTATDRRTLARAFRSVLGTVQDSTQQEFETRWSSVLSTVFRAPADTAHQRIQTALACSSLSHSAALQWIAQTSEAQVQIDAAAGVLEAIQIEMVSEEPAGNDAIRSSPWVERWYESFEPTHRQTMLRSIELSGGATIQVEFDILALTALGPGVESVREHAARVLLLGDRSQAILGALAVIEDVRFDELTQQTIHTLTSTNEAAGAPSTVLEARAALVQAFARERAMSEFASVLSLMPAVEESVAGRATTVRSGYGDVIAGVPSGQFPIEVLSAIHMLAADSLEDQRASPIRLNWSHSGTPIRGSGIQSAIHIDVEMRVSIAYALARAIAAEEPSKARMLDRIVTWMDSNMKQARTGTAQILVAEQAVARLWAARLGLNVVVDSEDTWTE